MPVRELIFNNFWLKLLSFVLATMIWFAIFAIQHDFKVSRDPAVRKFSNHSVTVMKAASDARGFKVMPSQVDVTVGGRVDQLENLREKDIEVYVNLTDVYDTDGLIKPVQVFVVPSGVTLIKVEPDRVRLERVRDE